MKNLFFVFLLLTIAGLTAAASPQEARPPLSKDELIDLLRAATPSRVIVSTINQCGIDFKPTPQILDELRRAGADKAVREALQGAWHARIPRPLEEREIIVMLAEDIPSPSITRTVLERGIDFQPTADDLKELQSHGAQADLIDALRTSKPRPYSEMELVQQLRAGTNQDWIAQKARIRAIDFDPNAQNLQSLRNAGARAPLLEVVRTAPRVKPFVEQIPAAQAPATPLAEGKSAPLICEPADKDVPVFADAGDIGNVVAHLRCGEQVTFLGRSVAPPGFDQIRYADGKEGFVPSSFLESQVGMVGGDVKPPAKIFSPVADYTPQARHDHLEGVVRLAIVIDTQGYVSAVREVSQPLGDGLDQSAIDAVKKWRFAPATRDGVPVAVQVTVEVNFRLLRDTH